MFLFILNKKQAPHRSVMAEAEEVTWGSGASVPGGQSASFMGLDCVLSATNHGRARRWIRKPRSAVAWIFLFTKCQHFQVELYTYGSFSSCRHAKYYTENGVEKRTLIKVFGIRFDILVFGTVSLCFQPRAPAFLTAAVLPQGVNALLTVAGWHCSPLLWGERGKKCPRGPAHAQPSDDYKTEAGESM